MSFATCPSRRVAKAAVCLSLLASSALGAGTASAYRPFEGTDGDVADPGEFELELGPLHYARQGKENILFTPVVLNLGIIPRMELVADLVPFYPEHRGPTQLTGTDVLAKYLLRSGVLQEETGPSIALEAGPLLPELRGVEGFGATANLIVSERWAWLKLHLNDEAQLSRKDLKFGWSTSLMGEADVGAPVRPVAELTWETVPSAKSNSLFALVGGIWNVTRGFDLDAAGRVGSVDGARAFEIRLGLTWAVALWTTAADGAQARSVVSGAAH